MELKNSWVLPKNNKLYFGLPNYCNKNYCQYWSPDILRISEIVQLGKTKKELTRLNNKRLD